MDFRPRKFVESFRPLGYVPQPAAIILGITAEEVPEPEFGRFGYSPLQIRPVIVPRRGKVKKVKKKKSKKARGVRR